MLQTAPTTEETALAAFVRALTSCETTDEVLCCTLYHVLARTAAPAGVALGGPQGDVVVPAEPPAGLLAAAKSAWAAGARDADVWVLALPPQGPRYGLLALAAGPPDDETAAELATVARLAGRLLEWTTRSERANSRLTELNRLYEVATAMNSTLDLPELLGLIVARTQEALRSEACTLMLLDEGSQELVFEIPSGEAGNSLRRLRIPISQGIAGWVARNGEPALVNDLQKDTRFSGDVDAHSGFVTRCALCVPLRVRGRISGVLEVLNKPGDEGYNTDDLELLTTLAGQAAVALDNAALYTSLQAEHARVLAAEEQVRKELARDLHDGPAQRLAAIVMQVEVLRKLLTIDPTRLPGELDALEGLARKANREVRTMQFQLRPVMLETRGLRAAIEYYVNQLRETEQVAFTLDIKGCEGRLPTNAEQAAFAIVQEALGNIRKHSAARNATIRMAEDTDQWFVTISDDGRGFDVQAVLRSYENRGSLGLLNMRERAQAVGGRLDLTSTVGSGTTVKLVIPDARTEAGGE